MLGRWAHDYVRVQIEQLHPGRVVVVAIVAVDPAPPSWDVDAPKLCVAEGLSAHDVRTSTETVLTDRVPRELRAEFASESHQRRLERFLRAHGVETILAQWMHPDLPLVALARRMRLRYVCQTHGTDITAALRDPATRRAYAAYNETAGVVAPSEFGRGQLVGLGIRPERAHVVRHPVVMPPAPAARPERPPRCFVVGRMEPMKSPLLVVEAFRRALAEVPGMRLDYAGDGSMRPEIEAAVDAAGLRGSVTLHGYLPHAEVQRRMLASDLFLHPSQVGPGPRFDTCPVAVAEAMSAGMAIVATRHGGIPEEVVDGESGLLVDEGDTAATATAIVRLARDPALRRRLGEAARARAEAMFAPEVVRRDWLELLGLPRHGSVLAPG